MAGVSERDRSAKLASERWIAVGPMRDRRILEHGARTIFPDGLWFVVSEANPEQLPIAVVDRGNDNHAPTRADAERIVRLIAAAPELLATLKAALAEIGGEDGIGAVVDVLESAGRAAVAKAEGRS